MDFYRTLGTGYVPNSILSQIQLYEGDPDPEVKVPVEKFKNYIFNEDATHGKNVVYEKLSYSKNDSEYLVSIYKERCSGAKLAYLIDDAFLHNIKLDFSFSNSNAIQSTYKINKGKPKHIS